MDFSERAARNEDVFRDINKNIDAGAKLHDISSPQRFHCECGQSSCDGEIYVVPSDYERAVNERYRFIVIPGHELPEIERVVETHAAFNVVEKVGEARAQIDDDHPQEWHTR